jgi:hypothetical protein
MNRIGRDRIYGLARTGNITLRVGQLRLMQMGRDCCQLNASDMKDKTKNLSHMGNYDMTAVPSKGFPQ